MVSEDLYQHKAAEKDGACKAHPPQDRVSIGHKPGGKQPQRQHGQGAKVRQHTKQSVKPFQNNKSDFKWKNLWVHLYNSTSCLDEDKTWEKDANGAVIAGVVGVTVDHLVGSDDHQACEGGDETTHLQDPMPADLDGARTYLSDGGGPRREEENSFRHQHCILQQEGYKRGVKCLTYISRFHYLLKFY